MRILFNPSFGAHLLSVQQKGESYFIDVFETPNGKVGINQLGSGTYYLDLQRNEALHDALLPYVANISHSCWIKEQAPRALGEYRYKTATAIVTTGIPPKSDKAVGFHSYHMEFSGTNPADVRELEKRFFLGTITPYKIAGEQPKTFKEVLELFLQEYSPITFWEKVKLCIKIIFKFKTDLA